MPQATGQYPQPPARQVANGRSSRHRVSRAWPHRPWAPPGGSGPHGGSQRGPLCLIVRQPDFSAQPERRWQCIVCQRARETRARRRLAQSAIGGRLRADAPRGCGRSTIQRRAHGLRSPASTDHEPPSCRTLCHQRAENLLSPRTSRRLSDTHAVREGGGPSRQHEPGASRSVSSAHRAIAHEAGRQC